MFKFTLLLTLLWLPSLLLNWNSLDDFFTWRHQLTMYSGFLGLGYMGLAVLLAARFRWVEHAVTSLDKGYQLHKHLGIGAMVALFAHWLVIKSGHWFVEAGIVARPDRGPRLEIEGMNWQAIAEQVGDISFKVFIIFGIISLVQAISYKKFKFTHKIGGLLMIAGVFHALFLLDWTIAAVPMNVAIVIISAVGVWCSCLSLSGQIGKKNKVTGKVANVEAYSVKAGQNMAVRFSIDLESDISYKEGQFAYLDFHDGESPHPFSVLNFDTEKQTIDFGVKDLGDYTHKLVNTLKAGQKVTVEGGYGAFQIPTFENQVWVGAGIGIVPFISRLYWLKMKSKTQSVQLSKVHLFYCVNNQKEAFFHKEIMSLLKFLDFIELHIIDAEKGEFLNSDQIIETANSQDFDVCFCGPQGFGDALKVGLDTAGVPEQRFHTEIFKMR